jgi:hypothetical protein
MIRQRLLLECQHCRQVKLVDVVVRDDGVMGLVKCDECKARDILTRTVPRRPTRRPISSRDPTMATKSDEAPPTPNGRFFRRLRLGLGNVFGPAH